MIEEENINTDTLQTSDSKCTEHTEMIASYEAQLLELKEHNLRCLAENDNLRKRFQKEKEDLLKYGITNLAKDLLPIADNLWRAMQTEIDKNTLPQAVQGFITGVELTIKEMEQVFTKHHIKRHVPHGEKFDPNLHQAVFEVENTEQEAGTVVQVLQDGYVMHERLLRPAMVGVTKKSSASDDVATNG